ncbi:universal stress protein, partial [Williamsia sp. D3]|uniref:universal stress protein n=1 Tax=Williamsia sp. D3 TaxID=1313067 RepID=UPI001378F972
MVGVDGSQSAVAAVRWAAADAAAHGSELVLVASAFPPVTTPFPEGFYIDLRGQAENALAAATEQARAVASTAELTVTTQIASESPVAALLEASAGARMLVVGSRGAGAVARWVLGSVSTALAAHTTIPLTVVPSGWSTGETEPADTTGTAGDGRRDAVV